MDKEQPLLDNYHLDNRSQEAHPAQHKIPAMYIRCQFPLCNQVQFLLRLPVLDSHHKHQWAQHCHLQLHLRYCHKTVPIHQRRIRLGSYCYWHLGHTGINCVEKECLRNYKKVDFLIIMSKHQQNIPM